MNPQYPMGPPPHPGTQPMPPPPPPSDRPSPVGLAVAGVGLALLCVSMLLPRIKVDDPEGEMAYFSFSFSGTGAYGIDTGNVVLSVALLAAVGMSAHRSPALRWPSRLSAIGTAALLVAFAYHPVTVMRQAVETYMSDDGFEDEDFSSAEDIDITADSGVYLVLVAAILLALSCFLMQTNPRRNQSFLSYQEMQPPPGNNPTVTVNPG
jgi:hypothetical protein